MILLLTKLCSEGITSQTEPQQQPNPHRSIWEWLPKLINRRWLIACGDHVVSNCPNSSRLFGSHDNLCLSIKACPCGPSGRCLAQTGCKSGSPPGVWRGKGASQTPLTSVWSGESFPLTFPPLSNSPPSLSTKQPPSPGSWDQDRCHYCSMASLHPLLSLENRQAGYTV